MQFFVTSEALDPHDRRDARLRLRGQKPRHVAEVMISRKDSFVLRFKDDSLRYASVGPSSYAISAVSVSRDQTESMQLGKEEEDLEEGDTWVRHNEWTTPVVSEDATDLSTKVSILNPIQGIIHDPLVVRLNHV